MADRSTPRHVHGTPTPPANGCASTTVRRREINVVLHADLRDATTDALIESVDVHIENLIDLVAGIQSTGRGVKVRLYNRAADTEVA